VGKAFLNAGLVDELSIHLVPVLFGSGTRLFEDFGARLTHLENLSAMQTRWATHLRFGIPKPVTP
jgi:riboflavin biosynthesis pyrimidine reductase